MCPIHYTVEEMARYAHFVCPLPLGYRKIIVQNLAKLQGEIALLVKSVNSRALKLESPFQNILIEYQDRDEQGQKSLLQGFQIRDIGFNQRGLYSVAIHGAYGDIYLDEKTIQNCDSAIFAFKHFFEPNVAFHCHNVDYYWQALLTREVAVEYFNLLLALSHKERKREAE